MNTGKILESFIRQIEKILLPHEFKISSNEKVFNDEGIQIAEFDIEIEGKVGSTNLKWLIECRDRPTQGVAPGSWIEQLVGRRDRFKFNKVIAVSTTGFAEGAISYAQEADIEIRTVTESNLEQIRDWFLIETMSLFKRGGKLENATLLVDPNEPEESRNAVKEKLKNQEMNIPILSSTDHDGTITVVTAFQSAINSIEGLYDPLIPQGGTKPIKLRVAYPKDESHYFVKTSKGNVRIKEILFHGEISVTVEDVPIAAVKKYHNLSGSEDIATTANFNFDVDGNTLEISFNKLSETGETHVLLRKINGKA